MSEWKEYKLRDLCSISSSKRIFANEYQLSGIPFYRGKEIIEKQKGEPITNELFISEDRYNEIKEKYGTLEDEAGFCAVKTLQDIAAQDFILTPGRYVGIAEQEDDGEPFEEKMQRLTSELGDLFAESHRLEDEIKKQLGSIGFEI